MKTTIARSVCLLASMAMTFISYAQKVQEKEANKADPDYLSPFNVIGNKSDVPALKGSGAVLDPTDLAPFFHTDINEILRQVPGVYIRPETGYGFFPNISLRGVDPNRSNKVTIMEDGIPSTPAPYADPAAYYAPTAGRMAGFEVLKGTSSLKHGPNTTGGVINYLSTTIPNQQTSHLRASYGSHNERIAHAYSGGKTDFEGGRLGYLVELFDHRSDGFQSVQALNGAPSRDSPITRTDILLKLSYEFGEGDYLEFKAGRDDMDADVSYQGLSQADYAANPYTRYAGTGQDNMDSDQTRYYLRYNKDFTDALSMSATLYLNAFNRDWYKLAEVYDQVDYGGTKVKVGGGLYSSATHINVLKGTATGSYKVKSNDRSYQSKGVMTNFDYEKGIHDFDLGFRYVEDDYDKNPYHEDKYNVTIAGTTTQVAKTVTAKTGNSAYKNSEAIETYLVDTIDLGSLKVSPGVRYSSIDYIAGTDTRTLDDVLLGIGAGYEISDTLAIFVGVHQGHTFPDAESAASDKLDHEESLNFELGARGSVANVFYEIAYFKTKLKDMLILSSLSSGVDGSANVGEATINGLEVLAGTDFGGNAGFGIPVSVGATFTDTEFESAASPTTGYLSGTSAGKKFPYVPDFMINLRAGLEFDKTRSYLNFHFQDSVYTDGANTETAKLNKYGSLDWSGFYDINEGVTVFTKVTNLTDETYVHSLLPDGYRVGAPRVWSVGMSYDF